MLSYALLMLSYAQENNSSSKTPAKPLSYPQILRYCQISYARDVPRARARVLLS